MLAAPGTAQVDLSIALGVQQRLPARLLAVRVSQEVADQRRRRLRATARDRGRTPSAARLAWADWTLLVTNVPPALLSLRETTAPPHGGAVRGLLSTLSRSGRSG